MSLFQAKEWWSFRPDQVEECDKGCLCVANIDNEPDGGDKIVMGSFQGMLRIFYPRSKGFRIEDMMLERQLDEPILQVEAAKVIPNSPNLGLIILHPRRVVVYSVLAVGGTGVNASYYNLDKAYEHKLQRTAHSMVYGPFGGVYGKDFICVQSMDGQLSVFEQESAAFSRYLPNFLVPGPLCYVSKIDSFVTVSADMRVEAYKYHMLGAASDGKQSNGDAGDDDEVKTNGIGGRGGGDDKYGLKSAKNVQVDWSLNLGEHGLDVFVAQFSHSLAASHVDILVLGERTLFTIKEQGQIRLQKRLEYMPSTCVAYSVGPNGAGGANQNVIVATQHASMMVYQDTQLKWAARCADESSPAVDLAVSAFGGVRGMIVTVTDSCHLQISYLGTDPPSQSVSVDEVRELDYAAMDEEHRELLKVIRDASNDTTREPSDVVQLSAQVPDTLDDMQDSDDRYEDDSSRCRRDGDGNFYSVTVRLDVAYSGDEDINNISLSMEHSDAFVTDSSSLVVPKILGTGGGGRPNTPTTLYVRFKVSNHILPTSLTVRVMASYVTSSNEPRISSCEFELPLCLACQVVMPIKNPKFMFTLDTNRPPPKLSQLFGDIIAPAMGQFPDLERSVSNVMSVKYFARDCDVTILVSKKAGRFRLQGGDFEALWLVARVLVDRLYELHSDDAESAKNGGAFAVSFQDKLPLSDYFRLVVGHFGVRAKLVQTTKALEQQAHQFRVVQKRLLMRYKDKNPTPLGHLDTLLMQSYESLMQNGDRAKELQENMALAANRLSCATNLLLLLVQYKNGLSRAEAKLLAHYLSPTVSDSIDQGWHEQTNASMMHLLRTVLARSGRDQSNIAQPLRPLDDTQRLKKHIQLVCDRLGKGLRLIRPRSKKKQKNKNNNN